VLADATPLTRAFVLKGTPFARKTSFRWVGPPPAGAPARVAVKGQHLSRVAMD